MSTGPRRSLKQVARAALIRLVRAVARQPRIKRLARAALDRFPSLQTRVHGLLHRSEPLPPRRPHVPQDVKDLSPATLAIYRELKRHFEAGKR
jgi:hypothetical protein